MTMIEPEPVETIKQARDLSLKKWEAVRVLKNRLFDEADLNCGFCAYGGFRLTQGPRRGIRCDHCTVEPRCKAINGNLSRIQADLERVIDETIHFLVEMKTDE